MCMPMPIIRQLSDSSLRNVRTNMVNFGQLAAQIGSLVWGIQANFNGFRVLAALVHDTVAVGVSQTLLC